LAAQAVAKMESAYGAFYRRMRAMHGPKKAMVATAHKIARAVYLMRRFHQPFYGVWNANRVCGISLPDSPLGAVGRFGRN
jgi:hypothetical protein